jgi:lysophospholipase L1-like esterase
MRILISAYLVLVHALLGVAVVKTDLVPRVIAKLGLSDATPSEDETVIAQMRAVQAQMDPAVPEGATLFLGDSITIGLTTAALAPFSVNYGIGGQRSDQLIKSMDTYASMERAARVVVTIGTNDLLQGREAGIASRYEAILAKIPRRTNILMNSVPRLGDVVGNGRGIEGERVRQVVASAKAVCAADPRCRFVDAYEALTQAGALSAGTLLADNVHLTAKGYRLWIASMRPALSDPASQ